MNLSDFRTRSARVSGMSTSDSGDTALLDAWANEAVIQFLRDTKINVQRASMAVTASSGDYTLDSDILSFVDIWMEPASGATDVLLEAVDSAEITRMRLFESTNDTSSRYYAIQGANLLKLYPAPESSSDLLHIEYVPRPSSTLSATADDPSSSTKGGIPSEYHPTLEAYVKWKACEAEEHKPSENGLQFQAEYERGVAKIRADAVRKGGVMRARARWGRRRRFPTTPGIDIKYWS